MRTRRDFLRGTTGLGALLLSGGKLFTSGGGLATIGASAGGTIQMLGGMSSNMHLPGTIVAAFANLDNTALENLNITSFSDGAGGTKYTLDQFNNVLAAGPGTVGTDTISVAGTADGVGAFAQTFPITVHDSASLQQAGRIVFTPSSGAGVTYYPNSTVDPNRTVVDVTTLPATGSVLGTLSVTGDARYSSPTFSWQELGGDNTGYASISVSASGIVTTATDFGTGNGTLNMHFTATQAGVGTIYTNVPLFYCNSRLPPTGYQTSIVYTVVTSNLASLYKTSVVSRIQVGFYDQGNLVMVDDQGGLFQLGIEDVPPYSLFVRETLTPGSYNVQVRSVSKYAWNYVNSSTQLTTIPITVIDGTPTSGASISATPPTGLLNNARVGTTVLTPTATGITGAQVWCLHQSNRMSFAINNSTGVVTTRKQLQRGSHKLLLVCSDGTNNASLAVTIVVAKTIGPSIAVDASLSQISGVQYPSLTAFLLDLQSKETGTPPVTNSALSGAQVTINPHPSGSWTLQTGIGVASPWDLVGAGSSRVWIKNLAPSAKALLDMVDNDFSITNIRLTGGHGAPFATNGRDFFPDGSEKGDGWYVLIDCEFGDSDHGFQGGGLGCIFQFKRSMLRMCSIDGQTHNFYATNIRYFEIKDSLSYGVMNGGHALKTRAAYGLVTNSVVGDFNSGQSSSPIDISTGGWYLFACSTFQLGANCQNTAGINWHAEGPFPASDVDVLQTDRVTLISDAPAQTTYGVRSYAQSYFNTPFVQLHSNLAVYGFNDRSYDMAAGTAIPVVDISPITPSSRPALALTDPSTGTAPVANLPPFLQAAAPNAGSYGLPQSIQTSQVINASASAPDGTIIDTFSLVNSPHPYCWSSKHLTLGGTVTVGDTIVLTVTSTGVNAQYPSGFSPQTITVGPFTSGNTTASIATALVAAYNANTTISGQNVAAYVATGSSLIYLFASPSIAPTLSYAVAVTGAATETATFSDNSDESEISQPTITSPTWAIDVNNAAAATVARATNTATGYSIGYTTCSSTGNNTTGLAVVTNSDGTASLTKQGTLATGTRNIVVMATQTGTWPKSAIVTVLVGA